MKLQFTIIGLVSAVQCASFLEEYRNDRLCTDVDCLGSAYRIKKAMDFNVDPCDNIYKFVCGGFLNNTRIPDDKSRVSRFSSIGDELLANGRELLESEVKEEDMETVKLAKNLYSSCVDFDAREEACTTTMKLIVDSYGGFPIIKEDIIPWPELIMDLHRTWGYSTNIFVIGIQVGADAKESSKRSIYVDQPGFGISREFLIKGTEDRVVQGYKQYILEAALMTGLKKNATTEEKIDIEKEFELRVDKMLQLEIDLAKVASPKEERRNETALYNPFAIKDLAHEDGHPLPSWHKYISNFFEDIHEITEDEVVIVRDKKYFKEVAKVLSGYDNKVVSDYILWRAVQWSMPYLNSKARGIKHNFDKISRGLKEQSPLSKRCAKTVGFTKFNKGLKLVAGRMYVDANFPPSAKALLQDLINKIKLSFDTVLDEINWMDEATRAEAKRKLEALTYIVGYPDEILDDVVMQEFHAPLLKSIADNANNLYFKTELEIERFWTRRDFQRLRSPVIRGEWSDMTVALVNAFYDPQQNMMVYPAGILRGAFFNKNVPSYLNYGAIGFVIGHEISHGFDDQGRQTDAEGNVNSWWTEKSEKAFLERAQCVIDQYSNFEVEQIGLKLNGINTQGENIADNVGLVLAYKAYERFLQDEGTEAGLPGLPFSGRQLLWISNVHAWCSKITDEGIKQLVLTDPHSPSEFRTIGSAINSDEFSRDFNCPVGSAMNPKEKCKVWFN